MKKITTISSDFDGTILKNRAQHVDGHFFPIIDQLKQSGVSFIAASGRQYANLRRLLAPVADEICFICENGALVAQGSEILYTSAVERSLGMELIDDMRRMPGTEIVVSSWDASNMVPENTDFADMLRDKVRNDVRILDTFKDLKEDMIKISICWHQGIPGDEERWFHEKYDDLLHVVDGGNGWLDFTNKGTDKGGALSMLSRRQGFRLEDVLSFGDSENDMTMLTEAGLSYAMDTAKPHVKDCADRICSDVYEILQTLYNNGGCI